MHMQVIYLIGWLDRAKSFGDRLVVTEAFGCPTRMLSTWSGFALGWTSVQRYVPFIGARDVARKLTNDDGF